MPYTKTERASQTDGEIATAGSYRCGAGQTETDREQRERETTGVDFFLSIFLDSLWVQVDNHFWFRSILI